MKIALIGYGKMGRAIEEIAESKGHEIVARIDQHMPDEIGTLTSDLVDVAIEFSQPGSAFYNVSATIRKGIPTISGTTGWLDRLEQIEKLVKETNGTFLHSSNFSVGVNLFFELNEWLASRMKDRGFSLEIEEIHHTEKLDAPSGTAIRLAQGIQQENSNKKGWLNEETTDQTKIGIVSKREPNVPGTHTVKYASSMEEIEIKHTAQGREIFAQGALDVAEWISKQSGFLTMTDYLNYLR